METLHQEFTKSNARRRRIMRRVWTTFVVSLVACPAWVFGFLFGASLIAFWKLVSVMSIISNVLNQRVVDAPAYAWHSVVQTELITATVFAIIVSVSLLILAKISSLVRLPQYFTFQGA